MEDVEGSLWLYMACGLVMMPRTEFDAWVADPLRTVRFTLFDHSEGVPSHSYSSEVHAVTQAADGTIWFAAFDGVSVIDPRRVRANSLAPPVHIEQLTVDRRPYDARPDLRLPPPVRDLQIDYAALSLVAPERNQFRVWLEGRDRGWQEVGNRRQAFYTDLEPRAYRFRVIASNNSGVWNEAGAAVDFFIEPAYYQTTWFRALMIAGVFATAWAGYLVRVRQVTREYQQRLDERVNERTRIARDLHDTLLQSFHGLLLRFQTASYLLPERPADAKETLDSAIHLSAKALTEGRNAVQGLRASTVERNDLALAIRTLGDELSSTAGAGPPPAFGVAVEGQPRELHPIVRDEVFRIAAEALRNAFRHAQAARVEVEIRYDDRQFRLRVRDDGKGIDPKVLANHGLEGHYGLRGMPERAAVIGGSLAVWSEAGQGTEVELQLPAGIGYAIAPRRSWWPRPKGFRTPT
jgi:signal transduction histidine kinase